ncbi:MAG TPA: DinB family protein [Thermoanaerobaculia bacterium]|jgi:uncharacterized damage-inducible protein DinB
MDTLLEEAIEAWEDARNGVIAEVENLPANRFDFRPTPDVRSVTELVIHILEVSLMMAGELTREDTNLRRYPWPKLIAHYSKPIENVSGKRQLLAKLRSTLREGTKKFRSAGEIHMLQQIVRFDGNKGTRLEWFHHGIAQEMYHRGQLTLYARLIGLKPALTQRIEQSST